MSDIDPRYTADDRSAPRLAPAGPVPPAVGAIVVGAMIGLAVLRRAFRGA